MSDMIAIGQATCSRVRTTTSLALLDGGRFKALEDLGYHRVRARGLLSDGALSSYHADRWRNAARLRARLPDDPRLDGRAGLCAGHQKAFTRTDARGCLMSHGARS